MESIVAGKNKWFLQIGVAWGRVSHPKWRLVCAQIFKVPITMGLDVYFEGEKGRGLQARAWGEDVEHESDSI